MKQQESFPTYGSLGKFTWTSFLLSSMLVGAPSFAADAPPAADKQVKVAAESYTEPKPKVMSTPSYPQAELDRGEQGWVFVQMMIDPNGKAYELEVVNSTGNKEFEKRALQAASTSTFVPATLGDKPVDAMVVMPVFFRITDETHARPEFQKRYMAYMKLLKADDKAGAQTALANLQPKNLYENSYAALARFGFAQKWGTEEEQLLALRAAVAGMTTPAYLEKEAFTLAVRSLFIAETKAQNYAAALAQWKTLKALEKRPEILKPLEPVVAKIEAIKTDPHPYTVKASLPEGAWNYPLYRNKFFIKVVTGRVSQIKLYCEKKYVLFPFDPTLEYKVDDKFGKCSMVVLGDGGTNIELTQTT